MSEVGQLRRFKGVWGVSEEYVIFMAEKRELADHYADKHDLAIIEDPKRERLPFEKRKPFTRGGNYEDMLYNYESVRNDPLYFFAVRLEPFDSSKGDYYG